MLLIVVSGVSKYAPYSGLEWSDSTRKQLLASGWHDSRVSSDSLGPTIYEHGWPRPFLIRSKSLPIFGGYYRVASTPLIQLGSPATLSSGEYRDYVSWSSMDNWPIGGDEWRWHFGYLLLDALVALTIVVGCAIGWEWWIRRRGGLWRFWIFDCLVVTTALGLFLSWWLYHARLNHIEKPLIGQRFGSDAGRIRCWERYSGPDWLRRLAGDADYLPFLHHSYQALLGHSSTWRDDMELLVRLDHIEVVELPLPYPVEVVEQLKECRGLSSVILRALPVKKSHHPFWNDVIHSSVHPYWKDRLAEHDMADMPLLDFDSLSLLGELRLAEVRLIGAVLIAEDIEQLLESTSLRRLRLESVSISASEIASLQRRFPETEIEASGWRNNGIDEEATQRWRRWRGYSTKSPN